MGTRLDDNGLATVLEKIKNWANGKFVTDAGVTSFNGQTGAVTADIPAPSTTTPSMDGTGSAGSGTTYARADHVHPSDDNKVDKVNGKGLSTNDFTTALKNKLDGIEDGAEVNVQADWNVTSISSPAFIKNKPNIVSTITLFTGYCDTAASTNAKVVTLDDATGFPSTSMTGVKVAVRFKYGHTGIGYPTLNVYSSGAHRVAIAKDATTYSTLADDVRWGPYETLIFTYNGEYWVRGTASSMKVYTIEDALNDKAPTDSPALSGTPTAPTAAPGTNTLQVATTAFVNKAISDAVTGVASFKGVVNSGTDISGLQTYTTGEYWVVGTAGSYVNQYCEAGDFIYCISDYSSAYSSDDFSVVQNNTTALTTSEINTIWNTVFNGS